MRLVNVLALTNAKLINDPFVSNFTNIVFDAKAVKRGDLFIAFDEETIEDAILNGAYGVIFDKPTQISDNEIAWIKVSNIEEALTKLLRFKLIQKEITVYSCDEVTLRLAQQITIESKFIILDGDLKSIAESLWNIDENSIVLFCPTFSDETIFTDINPLTQSDVKYIRIVEKTLFETSFVYADKYYERFFIVPLFIENLNNLITLFKNLKLEFRIKKFSQLNYFQAVFINKKFDIKDFGATDKVLIFEKNMDLITQEIEYLHKNTTWAKTIYILPSSYKKKQEEDSNVYIYKTQKEIIKILKKHSFHFALIAGKDKSILKTPIVTQTQLTLDF